MFSSRFRSLLRLATPALLGACGLDYSNPYPTEVPSPALVDVVFCSDTRPAWVAYQDGDGSWTQVAPEVGDHFATVHLSLESALGGIAVARDHEGTTSSLLIQYAAARELADAGDPQLDLCGATADRNVKGSVNGLAADEIAVVSANRSTREVVSLNHGSNEFTLGSVSSGPQEILFTRLKNVDGVGALTGFILRHTDGIADDAVLSADFASAEVVLPVSRKLELSGFSAGAVSRAGLRTLHSPDRLTSVSTVVSEPSRTYLAAPAALLGPNDLQFIRAETTIGNTNVSRTVTTYFREPVDLALGFGAIPATPSLVAVPASSGVRLRAILPAQADYDQVTSVNYQQGQTIVVSVSMTSRYATLTGGDYDMSIPELSSVAGFQPRWLLQSGATILWTTARIGGLAVSASPQSGSVRRIATDAGFITP